MGSMDSLEGRGRGQSDAMKEGVTRIEEMGEELESVKDQLEGMPGGLDSDLQDLIREGREAAREDARRDIEDTQSKIIDATKKEMDTIKDEVGTKISENTSAVGKIDGINSKYGSDTINKARKAIEENTNKGNELLRMLDEVIETAERNVESVKGRI